MLRGATRLKAIAFTYLRCIGRSRTARRRKAPMMEQEMLAAVSHRPAALLSEGIANDHAHCHAAIIRAFWGNSKSPEQFLLRKYYA